MLAVHGIWAVGWAGADPEALYGGSWAIGTNTALTAAALSSTIRGRLPWRWQGLVGIIEAAPVLAGCSAVAATPGRTDRVQFAAIGAWSGALLAHGGLTLAFGPRSEHVNEPEPKKSAEVTLAPTILPGGRVPAQGPVLVGRF